MIIISTTNLTAQQREQVTTLAQKHNLTVSASLTTQCQLLVCNGRPNSQKCIVARQRLRIPIVHCEYFLNQLQHSTVLPDHWDTVAPCYGLNVCCTAITLQQRTLLEKQVQQQQGTFTKNLTADCDLLVCSAADDQTDKMQFALKHSIATITFDQFQKEHVQDHVTDDVAEVPRDTYQSQSLTLKQTKSQASIQELSALFGYNSQVPNTQSQSNFRGLKQSLSLQQAQFSLKSKRQLGFLRDCTFALDVEDAQKQLTLQRAIEKFDGEVVKGQSGLGAAQYLVQYFNSKPIKVSSVTDLWLEACVDQQSLLPREKYFWFTPRRYKEDSLKAHVVALSGYDALEREHLKRLCQCMGAEVTTTFSRKNTLLLSPVSEGLKQQKAREWSIAVVDESCILDKCDAKEPTIKFENAFEQAPTRNVYKQARIASFTDSQDAIILQHAQADSQSQEHKPLKGQVLSIGPKLRHKWEELRIIASQLGATATLQQTGSCTHLITNNKTLQPSVSGVKVVSYHWLYECKRCLQKVDESLFPPSYNPSKGALQVAPCADSAVGCSLELGQVVTQQQQKQIEVENGSQGSDKIAVTQQQPEIYKENELMLSLLGQIQHQAHSELDSNSEFTYKPQETLTQIKHQTLQVQHQATENDDQLQSVVQYVHIEEQELQKELLKRVN